jgi:hypothetical protein
MKDRPCTDAMTHEAVGSIEAQNVITGLKADAINVDMAWLKYVELAARFGKNGMACRAYVVELAKRAAT